MVGENREVDIAIGKALLKPVLETLEYDTEEFLQTMLADGHAFNPYWARYRAPKSSEFEGKAKEDWENSDKCIEDRIAVAILHGLCTCYEDEEETGDIEDMTPHKLCEDDVYIGMATMAERYGWHYKALLDKSFDGETADVFLQCMALGEIVYG